MNRDLFKKKLLIVIFIFLGTDLLNIDLLTFHYTVLLHSTGKGCTQPVCFKGILEI